jgi:hypothetical protein
VKRRPVIAGILFLVIFLAVLFYSTFSLTRERHRVEVCMEFRGATNCAVGSGATQESALRTATSTACALISGGVTDSQQCERSAPVSVKWFER